MTVNIQALQFSIQTVKLVSAFRVAVQKLVETMDEAQRQTFQQGQLPFEQQAYPMLCRLSAIAGNDMFPVMLGKMERNYAEGLADLTTRVMIQEANMYARLANRVFSNGEIVKCLPADLRDETIADVLRDTYKAHDLARLCRAGCTF